MNYFNKFKINILYKYKNLIIFPLTTFYETNRSSLESEISLYIDYLNHQQTHLNFLK